MTDPGDRPPRWDPDERGIGVAEARAHVPALDALRRVATEDGWVAEEPEVHLLPHFERHSAAGTAWELVRSGADSDGTFDVLARWTGPVDAGRRTIRVAAYALIGEVAESTTFIRESAASGEITFEILTGTLPGESQFATHGHTLRLRLTVPSVGRDAAGADA